MHLSSQYGVIYTVGKEHSFIEVMLKRETSTEPNEQKQKFLFIWIRSSSREMRHVTMA